MTTITSTPSEVEERLEAFQPLIRATARRWARDGMGEEDLAQEIHLALWKVLQEKPEVPASYLVLVAKGAARDALRRGKSVDRLLTQGKRRWQVVSLEGLLDLDGEERGMEALEALEASRPRSKRDEDPVPDLALARVFYQDLWGMLTPRQRQVLELRLLEHSQGEIAALLGLRRQARVHYIMRAIQAKAKRLWEEPEPCTCAVCGALIEGRATRRYCSNACKCRAYRDRKTQ